MVDLYKYIRKKDLRELIQSALAEDIGSGDITTDLIVKKRVKAVGIMTAKAEGVICGLDVAKNVFSLLNKNVKMQFLAKDGDFVKPTHPIAQIVGDVRTLLLGERVALNFIQRLSGIATHTRRFVEKTDGTRAQVYDTRKTTPLLRSLEKYAVACGGGVNHRFGLYDQILVKDNHIEAAGGIKQALKKVSKKGKPVIVEVCTLSQVNQALPFEPDVIMLDNMTLREMKTAMVAIGAKAQIEVSGNVSLKSIRPIAQLGVDRISIGEITHSAPSLDISLSIKIK